MSRDLVDRIWYVASDFLDVQKQNPFGPGAGKNYHLFVCLIGDSFTDCTMVNHHQTIIWGISFLFASHFKQI